HTLALWHEPLARALGTFTHGEEGAEEFERARSLVAAFSEGRLPITFNWADARLIERALPLVEFVEVAPSSIPSSLSTALPVVENEPIIQAETAAVAGPEQWLDNLPGNPTTLVDVIGESGRNVD
ncbi:MAG: hypothetical protein H0X14_07650, partial [Acidobacteria bacterium]|nr:hypothetical protein [Acidobacteriota bacterium]